MELDDGDQDDGDDQREDQVIQLRKEEREKQKPRRSRQSYQIGFCFGTQDTIEGVSVFRIDIHTMKRGKPWLKRLSSATR
jgi:hypothetical protein